jgi:hypothetical protein
MMLMSAPMYEPDPSAFPLGALILAVGFVFMVLGWAILRRITRNPEDGPDHWRSHRRR